MGVKWFSVRDGFFLVLGVEGILRSSMSGGGMLSVERLLVKVSLICAIVGIGVLVVVAESSSGRVVQIGEVGEGVVGERVVVTGEVVWVRELPSLHLFLVKDGSGEVKVVAYRSELVEVRKGQRVKVEGVVSEYKGEVQVEAKRVWV